MELFISWIFSIGQSEQEGRGGDLATVETLATSTTHAIFLFLWQLQVENHWILPPIFKLYLMLKISPFSCSEPPTIWFGGCLTSKNNILENVIKRVFLDSSAEEKAFNIFRPFYFPCSRVSSGWQSAIIKRKAAPLPVVPLMKTVGCDMPGSHHVGGWMLIEVACQQRGLGSCQQFPHTRLMLGCHPARRGEYARDTLLGMGILDTGILYFVWEN